MALLSIIELELKVVEIKLGVISWIFSVVEFLIILSVPLIELVSVLNEYACPLYFNTVDDTSIVLLLNSTIDNEYWSMNFIVVLIRLELELILTIVWFIAESSIMLEILLSDILVVNEILLTSIVAFVGSSEIIEFIDITFDEESLWKSPLYFNTVVPAVNPLLLISKIRFELLSKILKVVFFKPVKNLLVFDKYCICWFDASSLINAEELNVVEYVGINKLNVSWATESEMIWVKLSELDAELLLYAIPLYFIIVDDESITLLLISLIRIFFSSNICNFVNLIWVEKLLVKLFIILIDAALSSTIL